MRAGDSERVGIGFAGADAHRVLERHDESLAVADLAVARAAAFEFVQRRNLQLIFFCCEL